MKYRSIILLLISCILLIDCKSNKIYHLENKYLNRVIKVENNTLETLKIVNKLNGKEFVPLQCEEFNLHLSDSTSATDQDILLSTNDFKVSSVDEYHYGNINGLAVKLNNKHYDLSVTVYYEIAKDEFYTRKFLEIESKEEITLERIGIEVMANEDVYQPYKLKMITARGHGKWKTGLGQPIYAKENALFFGIEFPASTNQVTQKQLNCGYLWGNKLKKEEKYTSYNSVIGVAEHHDFIDEAFYKYINNIRIRPLRLQVQYNSWFDFKREVNKENFKESITKIHNELVNKRKLNPLNAYVIDDGWQDSDKESDWSDTLWKINNKFSHNLSDSRILVDSLGSGLGLWLSPGCLFGAKKMVKKLGEYGYERLEQSMSMTGPKYMDKLEERILELTEQGIAYFKFDGLFGHLNIRDFELNGRGTPAMNQLNTNGFLANDERLNDSIYDELKTYYLVNGTERLIQLFENMAKINPDIFIAITNGAYLSPWWLQHIDVVWLINAGDAAKGGSRTDELCYRDGIYYEIWKMENTKFPMNAIFNHEPKKVEIGEAPETFKDYLFMNLSRGTGFIELYIKTENLVDEDWDVLAEGLKWANTYFPAFNNVRMHGGNPVEKKVYGYSGWTEKMGYISIHNPSGESKEYTLALNRKLGVVNKNETYFVSSPLKNDIPGLQKTYNYSDTLNVSLKPKQIGLLQFKIGTLEASYNKME